jgi:hypothetical protein
VDQAHLRPAPSSPLRASGEGEQEDRGGDHMVHGCPTAGCRDCCPAVPATRLLE